MKKILTICALLVLSQLSHADEEECPAAVDAAEAQNQNLYKNCDYSEKGLNGVLHRAFSGKKNEADEDIKEQGDIRNGSAKPVVEKKVVSKTELLKEGEIASAAQLPMIKFAALEKLALECTNGFVVEGERYLPVKNSKALKLELIYHCL